MLDDSIERKGSIRDQLRIRRLRSAYDAKIAEGCFYDLIARGVKIT